MRNGGKRFLFGLLLILATRCSPGVAPSSSPTLQSISVAYSPSLKLVEEALNSCAKADAGIALQVSELPLNELGNSEADLVLWFGEPPESAGFSAPLAREEIVIIVHPDNPTRVLSKEEIPAVLRGEVEDWGALVEMDVPVEVWVYPPGNEIQQVILDEFLTEGSIASSTFLAPDPAAMIEAVSKNRGAFGFLPRAWLTEEVVAIRLEDDGNGNLHRPILALSEKMPTGAVRNFLACLQSPTGQNALERRYESWSE